MFLHSQGGVKVPTGGNGHADMPQARERFVRQRQLIRCDSEADGDSPDERELQETALHPLFSGGAAFRPP